MGADDLRETAARVAERIVPDVVAWRHDIHQHPELGNREVRTATKIAGHLWQIQRKWP